LARIRTIIIKLDLPDYVRVLDSVQCCECISSVDIVCFRQL